MKEIILGVGCFWCLDAVYRQVNGVIGSVAGYSGGFEENPTYEAVCTGKTGHAEVVKLTYDKSVISLRDILHIFWVIHNPTTLNRQAADVGTQYRSVIYFIDPEDQAVIMKSLKNAQQLWSQKIVTEAKAAPGFYAAEDYHQDYFNNHPEAAYCQVIIDPKISKTKQSLSHLLK